MKRIKMPLNFRMQNFLFLPNGEIFWTSASKTIWQKIKRWWNKDKSEMCNTSRGFTLPFHGQYIRTDGLFIYRDFDKNVNLYELSTGKDIGLQMGGSKLPAGAFDNVHSSKARQGCSFNPSTLEYDFIVFGNKGDRPIDIKSMITGDYIQTLTYVDFCKSYWASWEAEGLQYDLDGNLWVGISVKTKYLSSHFGAILNYYHKL